MIRTTLSKAYIKRTLRPNYGWTQATPKAAFLDPNWDRSSPIWPGMGMARTSGPNYTLVGASMDPSGLAGLYVGGEGIDEPGDSGVNAYAVWVLDADAEFEVLAPAFDAHETWVDPGGSLETGYVMTEWGGATGGEPTGYPVPTTFTEGAPGTDALVYVRAVAATGGALSGTNGLAGPTNTYGLRGQLVPAGASGTVSTKPVARLLQVLSPTSIVIGGLRGTY